MTESTRIRIRQLRTEISFLRDEESHGGPNREEQRKDLVKQIEELEAAEKG